MVRSATDADRWLRRFRPAPEAGHRLVCFPHAGGSAGYFVPFAQALTPGVDVLAIQYPGRQDRFREPGVASVRELAERIHAVLRPYRDHPLSFFGHSMGAAVAFETARLLERDGVLLANLVVSGHRAPRRHRADEYRWRDDAAILAELRRLGGTDREVFADPELVQMVLPALRSDYHAVRTYRYEPGPDVSCPILALVGDADPRATPDELRPWAEHTTGSFELRVFPGGHFYLDEHRDAVLRLVAGRLGLGLPDAH